jgi:photosystem II stability/assembly factor-like uncharacterized protein
MALVNPASDGLPASGDDVVTIDDLAIDPSAPAQIYAASFAGVFASRNGGESWQPASMGLPDRPVLAVVVDPTDADVLFAGIGGRGIFKSTDGAVSWQPTNGGAGSQLDSASVSDLAIAGDDVQSVYAASSLGVLLSRDGGQSWSGVNDGLFVRSANASGRPVTRTVCMRAPAAAACSRCC